MIYLSVEASYVLDDAGAGRLLRLSVMGGAFFAVAQFRGVPFAQIVYGGDAVIPGEWDHRDWHAQASVREKLFWLAAEAWLRL